MSPRRIAALFLALVTLHLNLLSADTACASHDVATTDNAHMAMHHLRRASLSDAMPVVMQTSSSRAEHDSSARAGASVATNTPHQHRTPQLPCEIPSASGCCRALMSCSVVFFVRDVSVLNSRLALQGRLASPATIPPRFEIIAPDPPPPRI